MKAPTQRIEAKAWNPAGDLALHLVYHFSEFQERLLRVEEIAGSDQDRPFHYGMGAASIAARFVPEAEAAGWTAEIAVEGDSLPSKHEGEDMGWAIDLFNES